MAAEITDSDFFFRQIFKSPETMQEFLQDPANMEKILHFVAHDEINVYDQVDPARQSAIVQTGKVVAITGAGRGIGKATALMFAQANAKAIAICSRTISELEETRAEINEINPSTAVILRKVDITCEEDVNVFFKDIKQEVGKIDVAVSNSGANSYDPLPSSTTAQWWDVFEVNVKGPYLVAKYFASQLAGEPGTFVNISSCHALAAVPGQTAYCGSKVAAARIIEILHYEVPNMRCFSLHPGAVNTALVQDLERAMGFTMPWEWTEPALTGGTILWLTTERADFLRGRWLSTNWRVDELEAQKDSIVERNMLKLGFSAKLGL